MPLSAIQPDHYDRLLKTKISALLPAFEAIGAPTPTVMPSQTTGFRLRAEFRVWHEGEDLNYVMFRRGEPKTPIPVTVFPIAHENIQTLMPVLRERLRKDQTLRRKLFQIEFLTTLAGDTLVTLIYHRALDADWQEAAGLLAGDLGVSLVGRSRKQKLVIGNDWVRERLSINKRTFDYQQPEQAFTQPNGRVNEAMIEWAIDAAKDLGGDLLELYCGIGNFTLPLAGCFDNVIATELSKSATAAAQENQRLNGIENVEFARLSAEEMASALAGEREFRRLANLKQPLTDYRLKTLLVDPPRAGLDDKTLELAQGFDNIIYISCNPATLLENLEQLTPSHHINRLAFFDQFPYTDHMESGVLLTRRN